MRKRTSDVLFVPIIIVLGKLISFGFNALLGAYYGAGKISDAFIMAHSIPTILFEGVATALISCYIPIRSSIQYETPERVDEFNSNMTSIAVLLSLFITIIYYVFHHPLNHLYASGFDNESLTLLDKYTSIIAWSIPLIGGYSILRAHLQVSNSRSASSMGQIICYSTLIVSIVLFYPNDVSMAWATLVGNILCFAFFIVAAYRSGYKYHVFLSLKEDYVKSILLMIFPIFFSTLASEIASIVDKYFASRYSDGIITSLTYGYQLSFALQGIVSSSLLIIVFPILADAAAKKDLPGMNEMVYQCIEIVSWIVMPLVCGGMVLAEPIIHLLFGHGQFDLTSVRITATVFGIYLIGVLPMCVKHIGDRTCFALKKTNYAMITTFVTVGMNILLDYIMSKLMGYIGLVIATGISITAGSVSIFLLIKKDDDSLRLTKIVRCLLKPCVPTIIMIVVVLMLSRFVFSQLHYSLALGLCILLGGVIYVSFAWILYEKQIKKLISSLLRR